ncbi:MAG: HAD family phosphatase [Oscillospiraceae bacterium]|jgi:putative hydrolase of the HAD superfamily|nr:HAD family phosphatase [Oscillospiraceae bacterium]
MVCYQNIVFDMGGVLLDFSYERLLQFYFGNCAPAERAQVRAVFESGLWNRMDRGDFDAQGMLEACCAQLPAHLHAPLARMLPNYFEAMPPLPACELIPTLKAQGRRVFLLSNAPLVFCPPTHLPYYSLFDGVFTSCQVRLLKPEPAIYQAFLRQFNLEPEESFFIDDNRANIEAAAAAGIAGFCFDTKDLAGLKATLALQ